MFVYPQRVHLLIVAQDGRADQLIAYLKRQHYWVVLAQSLAESRDYVRNELPDLILLDGPLPIAHTWEIIRTFRTLSRTSRIPVIVISEDGEDESVIKTLDLGADDYIVKPVSLPVMLARVRAVLRSRNQSHARIDLLLGSHRITLDPVRHETFLDDCEIELSPAEFSTMRVLAGNPGKVFTRRDILLLSDGRGSPAAERSVDFRIFSLRKKLGEAGKFIRSVAGIGYKPSSRSEESGQ